MFNPAGSATGIGAASPTSQALFSAGTTGGTAGNIGIGASSTGAFTGSVTSQAGAQALSKWVTAANTPSSGMTTGDALAYMTKWNMAQTGLSALAGIYGGKEESKQAQLNREHEEKLIQMRIDADKAADEKRYAYGAAQTPEQKSFLAQNPGWLSTHPSTRAPGTRGLMSQSAMPIQQQRIGEPTFGRQGSKNISYSSPSGSPISGKKQGLIERGTSNSFNPNALRRYS